MPLRLHACATSPCEPHTRGRHAFICDARASGRWNQTCVCLIADSAGDPALDSEPGHPCCSTLAPPARSISIGVRISQGGSVGGSESLLLRNSAPAPQLIAPLLGKVRPCLLVQLVFTL